MREKRLGFPAVIDIFLILSLLCLVALGLLTDLLPGPVRAYLTITWLTLLGGLFAYFLLTAMPSLYWTFRYFIWRLTGRWGR